MAKRMTTIAVGDDGAPSPRALETEVSAKARRRTFTTAYKLSILDELDRCKKPGDVGAIVRREGLYSSSLVKWRRQRRQGELQAQAPVRRGPQPAAKGDQAAELAQLKRDNARLERQLAKAHLIIGIQKKAAQILDIAMAEIDETT